MRYMFSTCATTCQVQAGSFDQEIGGGPQGGGRGVHLVKEGGDALIQTGKKQRTSDGVRLRLDLETPQGPVCWLTCLWFFSNPIFVRLNTSLFLFFNVLNLTTWQFLPHSSHNCLVTSESSSQSRLFQLLSRSPNLLTSRQCHPFQYGPATMCGRNAKVFFSFT